MAFGRIRKWLQREPTRQELYLKLQRGLNIESDYQEWIDTWESYGPAKLVAKSALPLVLVLIGAPSEADRAFWTKCAASLGDVPIIWHAEPMDGARAFKIATGRVTQPPAEYITFLHVTDR